MLYNRSKHFTQTLSGNKDVLDMVSSDMEQRTVESGTALTFEPKMTRARTKQAFDSGTYRIVLYIRVQCDGVVDNQLQRLKLHYLYACTL